VSTEDEGPRVAVNWLNLPIELQRTLASYSGSSPR
jgi:hypothetical protein